VSETSEGRGRVARREWRHGLQKASICIRTERRRSARQSRLLPAVWRIFRNSGGEWKWQFHHRFLYMCLLIACLSIYSSEINVLCDLALSRSDDNIIRSMRVACWITEATDTHVEYVIRVCLIRALPVFLCFVTYRSCLSLSYLSLCALWMITVS